MVDFENDKSVNELFSRTKGKEFRQFEQESKSIIPLEDNAISNKN
jgi:hypothetical protein